MHNSFIKFIAKVSTVSKDPQVMYSLISYYSFLESKERAGIERAVASGILASDKMDAKSRAKLDVLISEQDTFIELSMDIADENIKAFKTSTLQGNSIDEVKRMRSLIFSNEKGSNFGLDSKVWFNTITEKINLLKKVDDYMSDNITKIITTKLENAGGYAGKGDFTKDSRNLLKRYSYDKIAKPLVYCGMQIINRKQYEKHNSDIFSANKIWDQNIVENRLFTVVTTKKFNHVGTKDSVVRLNK